jgi:hypothetical protein
MSAGAVSTYGTNQTVPVAAAAAAAPPAVNVQAALEPDAFEQWEFEATFLTFGLIGVSVFYIVMVHAAGVFTEHAGLLFIGDMAGKENGFGR